MKKLFLIGAAAMILTPLASSAQDWRPLRPEPYHWKISANEMTAGGFAAAAILGIAGYLIVRRRRAAA